MGNRFKLAIIALGWGISFAAGAALPENCDELIKAATAQLADAEREPNPEIKVARLIQNRTQEAYLKGWRLTRVRYGSQGYDVKYCYVVPKQDVANGFEMVLTMEREFSRQEKQKLTGRLNGTPHAEVVSIIQEGTSEQSRTQPQKTFIDFGFLKVHHSVTYRK